MPKLKVHSGTKDRAKVTKNGKVIARKPFGNHLLQNKSASRKRRFAGMQVLTGNTGKNIKKNLGV